jgi:lipopolysaccharide/colanic/teichoic acid biosynthesis glycosyltransferase
MDPIVRAAKDSGPRPVLPAERRDKGGETIASTIDLKNERLNAQRTPRFKVQRRRKGVELHEVLSQEAFGRIFFMEMKRAARSNRFFLLMLMDVGKAFRADGARMLLSGLYPALSSCTRETDIIGWYENESVLGVILTDIGGGDRDLIQKVVLAKVKAALCAQLTSQQVDQINFTFYLFPQNWEASKPDRSSQAGLDPEWPGQSHTTRPSHIAKRTLDILGSIVGLVLLSPLFLVISLAIKLTSRGPVLFRQERIGHRGVRFNFLKFRSMKSVNDPTIHREYVRQFIAGGIDSETALDSRIYKISEDPRVTRFGRLLRKTSLDELPQLINVLKGEMSLVGPRPPIAYEVEAYRAWHLRRLFEAKPGITGLWQVNGRSRTTFDEMVRLDLRYARNWSLWLDLKILLRTPEAILSGKGAY